MRTDNKLNASTTAIRIKEIKMRPTLKTLNSFLILFLVWSLVACSSTSPDVTMAKNNAEKEAITQSDEGHRSQLRKMYKRERAVSYQHRNFTRYRR